MLQNQEGKDPTSGLNHDVTPQLIFSPCFYVFKMDAHKSTDFKETTVTLLSCKHKVLNYYSKQKTVDNPQI